MKLAILMCFALASQAYSQNEVCLSLRLGSGEETGQQSTNSGPPGKIGPRGPPGSKGMKGDPGQCACDPSETSELKAKLAIMSGNLDSLNYLVAANNVLLCGVGLKNGRVKDNQITASSEHSAPYLAKYGRLDLLKGSGHVGCWEPRHGNVGEWIQVDLGWSRRITHVVTQGRPDYSSGFWVTSYKILYGNSTSNLQFIRNAEEADVIFQGNVDGDNKKTNKFPQPVAARYFRLVVQTWHNYIAVRHEYLTC